MPRILLIDDHELLRDGVKRIFDHHADPPLFGEAASAADALNLASTLDWDLVILDLSLKDGRSGLDILKDLRQLRPHAPVLVLSMHSEEQYARRAFKAGAAGYVTKDSSRTELAHAISLVLAGGKYVSPTLSERLVMYLAKDAGGAPHDVLSDREFEVMRLLASGKTVGDIAVILAVSDKTVSTYRARILEKMGLKTNAEIIRYAFANKIIE